MANRLPKDIWGIITPTINCIGDIYHYQEEAAGKYEFGGKRGHYAVRAIRRNIAGLQVKGKYPLEGYFNGKGKAVTKDKERLVFLNQPYLHLTNLQRSTQTSQKIIARERKYELGIPFPPNFRYPEVLSKPYPSIVPSPWIKQTGKEKIFSAVQTPFKKIKRRIIK